MDYNHQLYLHPSDAPGLLSIEIEQKGMKNYMLWSRTMKLALLARNKHGFIDGSVKKTNYEGDLHKRWDRCNAIVGSWLMSSVQSDLLNGILFRSNAYLVWNDLKERFDKNLLSGRVREIGNEQDGLYVMYSQKGKGGTTQKKSLAVHPDVDAVLWHRGMGRALLTILRRFIFF